MTKNRYIVIIDKSGIELYSEALKKGYKIDFLPNSIIDLEVISLDSLIQQISTVIETNKILPGSIVTILTSSVLFQKDFPISEDKKPINKFLDNIPFENLSSITIPITKTSERIIASNKDFYETIIDIFTKKGFEISGITLAPLLLGVTSAENAQSLIMQGLKKFESIKGDQFNQKDKNEKNESHNTEEENTQDNSEAESESTDEVTSSKKKITPRTVGLLTVFGVLILILLGLVLKIVLFPSEEILPNSSQNATQVEDTAPQLAISPTPNTPEDLSGITKSLTVKIQTVQQSATYAASIKEKFQNEGFQSITTSIEPDILSTQILFSNTVSLEVKNRVLDSISSSLPDITERTVSNTTNDITLSISQR